MVSTRSSTRTSIHATDTASSSDPNPESSRTPKPARSQKRRSSASLETKPDDALNKRSKPSSINKMSSNAADEKHDTSHLPDNALSELHRLLVPLKQNSTICPSQLARALYASEPDWRAAMDPVRDLVWECARKGWVEVTQKGEVRAWESREDIRGPIRVRRGPKWGEWNQG